MATLHWLGPGYELMSSPRPTDRLFERFFGYGESQPAGTPTYTLPVDILETDTVYELHATVAGVPPEGVEVSFEDGLLSIDVKTVPSPVQGKFIRQERSWGDYSRKLELPKEVDAASISADFDNGTLIVRVPKMAKAEPLRIAIGAGAEKAIEA